MNWEALGAIAELVGAVGAIVAIVYLAVQIRSNTGALRAQARYSISDLVLSISLFRAEHADRYAKLKSGNDLTPGDLEFRYWSHMQMMLHAETYLQHFEVGLMPESHWRAYARWIEAYVHSNGFREFWEDAGPTFSDNLRHWIDRAMQDDSGC